MWVVIYWGGERETWRNEREVSGRKRESAAGERDRCLSLGLTQIPSLNIMFSVFVS